VPRKGHGEQSALPPGMVKNSRCSVFMVDIDPVKAQEFVNETLVAPTGGEMEYHVLGSTVMVSFLNAERLYSTGEVIGYIPDGECAFWLPLIARKKGLFHLPYLTFWMPYIIIDNCTGMATGREVWGFAKETGPVIAPPMNAPGTLAARMVGSATLFKTFSMDTLGVVEPLIVAERPSTLGDNPSIWADAKQAFGAIAHELSKGGKLRAQGIEDDAVALFDLAGMLVDGKVPVVNLKQFRDAAFPERACYQALIQSPCTLHAIHGGGIYWGDWQLKITDCASHQIANDLGLASNVVPVRFACYVEMDFSADAGTEVWRAST
jgi:hypothetical protein